MSIRMVALKEKRFGGTGHPVTPVGSVFHAKTQTEATLLAKLKWAREEAEPAAAALAAPSAEPAATRPAWMTRAETAATPPAAKKVAAKKTPGHYSRRDLTAED